MPEKKFFLRNLLWSVAALAFLWAAWLLAHLLVKNDYLVPSFWSAMQKVGEYLKDGAFWNAFFNTFLRTLTAFFISFFGGSRVQIGGPTAAFVVIIYGIVTTYGTDGLIVATIMAGIILCIMGLCHFGSLIKYIPYTITTGFTCGIAVTLFVGQIKDFL